jgi:hypothetical protein
VLDRAHLSRFFELAGSGVGMPFWAISAGADESRSSDGPVTCEIIPFSSPGGEPGPVKANILAGEINHLCSVRNIRAIMLDGPQA